MHHTTTLGPADPPIDLRRSYTHSSVNLLYLCVYRPWSGKGQDSSSTRRSPNFSPPAAAGKIRPPQVKPSRTSSAAFRCGYPYMICNACSGLPVAALMQPAGGNLISIHRRLTHSLPTRLSSPQASDYKLSASLHHVPYLAPHTFCHLELQRMYDLRHIPNLYSLAEIDQSSASPSNCRRKA